MKTYAYGAGLVLAFLLVSCSKPAPTDRTENQDSNFSSVADLVVLLQNSSSYTTKRFKTNANGTLEPNTASPSFSGSINPLLTSLKMATIAFFSTSSSCEGKFILYDILGDEEIELSVFGDLDGCNWQVTAMTHTSSEVFFAYTMQSDGKGKSHFVKRVPFHAEAAQYEDIPLSKMGVALEAVGEKLFVLDYDEDITNENGLVVFNLEQNELMHEMNLGYDAESMFQNRDGHIIIAYPQLHTLVNSTNLAVSHTQYDEGTAPDFHNAPFKGFDALGKLYYIHNTQGGATESIPATYDFGANRTTLYYFENFLSTEQLELELNIKQAASLAFDHDENILYIGYQKEATPTLGGILRLQLDSSMGYLDHIELEGVPQALYLK